MTHDSRINASVAHALLHELQRKRVDSPAAGHHVARQGRPRLFGDAHFAGRSSAHTFLVMLLPVGARPRRFQTATVSNRPCCPHCLISRPHRSLRPNRAAISLPLGRRPSSSRLSWAHRQASTWTRGTAPESGEASSPLPPTSSAAGTTRSCGRSSMLSRSSGFTGAVLASSSTLVSTASCSAGAVCSPSAYATRAPCSRRSSRISSS